MAVLPFSNSAAVVKPNNSSDFFLLDPLNPQRFLMAFGGSSIFRSSRFLLLMTT